VAKDFKKSSSRDLWILKKSVIGRLRILEKPCVGIFGFQKIRDPVAKDFGKSEDWDLRI